MRAVILVCFVAAISACGVSDDAELAELTADEIAELCAGQSTDEVTCGEGDAEYTIEATDESDCATALGAAENGTVGNWRACSEAGDGVDFCDSEALTDLADNADCKALAGE